MTTTTKRRDNPVTELEARITKLEQEIECFKAAAEYHRQALETILSRYSHSFTVLDRHIQSGGLDDSFIALTALTLDKMLHNEDRPCFKRRMD